MSIASCLKEMAKERGWSQGEVARRVGLDRTYINRLFRGKIIEIGVRNAIKLARVFNLSVEEFWDICQGSSANPQGREDSVNPGRHQ